jgi:hypothetical protein
MKSNTGESLNQIITNDIDLKKNQKNKVLQEKNLIKNLNNTDLERNESQNFDIIDALGVLGFCFVIFCFSCFFIIDICTYPFFAIPYGNMEYKLSNSLHL